jgi:hypothetical protein
MSRRLRVPPSFSPWGTPGRQCQADRPGMQLNQAEQDAC